MVVCGRRKARGTRLLPSRSDDGGRSFSGGRGVPGSDAAEIEAGNRSRPNRDGRMVAIWLDHRELARDGVDRRPRARRARRLPARRKGVARAQHSKLFFAPLDGRSRRVPSRGGVCYCCKTAWSAARRHDRRRVAARVSGQMRDMAFTMSRDGGRSFARRLRVSEDRWGLDGCPDERPGDRARRHRRRMHIVWPTLVPAARGRAKPDARALLRDVARRASTFTPGERLPAEGTPRHPQLALGADGALVGRVGRAGQRVAADCHRPLRRSTASGRPRIRREPLADGGAGVYPAHRRRASTPSSPCGRATRQPRRRSRCGVCSASPTVAHRAMRSLARAHRRLCDRAAGVPGRGAGWPRRSSVCRMEMAGGARAKKTSAARTSAPGETCPMHHKPGKTPGSPRAGLEVRLQLQPTPRCCRCSVSPARCRRRLLVAHLSRPCRTLSPRCPLVACSTALNRLAHRLLAPSPRPISTCGNTGFRALRGGDSGSQECRQGDPHRAARDVRERRWRSRPQRRKRSTTPASAGASPILRRRGSRRAGQRPADGHQRHRRDGDRFRRTVPLPVSQGRTVRGEGPACRDSPTAPGGSRSRSARRSTFRSR